MAESVATLFRAIDAKDPTVGAELFAWAAKLSRNKSIGTRGFAIELIG